MAKWWRIFLAFAGCDKRAGPGHCRASPDAAVEPPPELKALADTCAAHRFETMVTLQDGKRATKVKICGKQGQTDADWLNTLLDPIRQAEANDALAAGQDQIVAALKAEISRLERSRRARRLPPQGLSPETRRSRANRRPNIRPCRRFRSPKPKVANSSPGTPAPRH